MYRERKTVVFCTVLVLFLTISIFQNVEGYSNSSLWSKNLVTYTPQKYRVSITDDQTMVVSNNGSTVVGLNTLDGQTSLSYLPARNGDIIDGVIIHPSKKYVASIVNGSFISIFNITSSRRVIFNANSTIKNILLPQTYSRGGYTLYYSTSDFSISRVDTNISGRVTLTWHIHLNADVNMIDSDDSSYRIVAGLNNGTLLVLNPFNGGIINAKNFAAPITSLKISSFGFFAVTTSDGMFYMIRTDNLYVLQSLSFGSNKGISSAISGDGEKIAVGLSNGTIFYLKYLTGETGRAVVSNSPVNIVADKALNYVAWSSGRQVGFAKYMENPLWTSTVTETTSDVSVAMARDNPSYVVGCSKTKIVLFDKRPNAQLTLSAKPSVVGFGKNITFSGQLAPALSGQTIQFSVQSNSTDIWKPIGTNLTDSLGRFQFTWKANVTGSPNIKAAWPGNSDFRETFATASVDVRKTVALTVKAITVYGKPIQNIRVTANGTRYYTDSTGYVIIPTYAGTVSLVVEKTNEFGPDSRYQFMVWETSGLTQNQLSLKINSDTSLIAKYAIAYRVNFTLPIHFLVDTSPGGSDGWFENGTSVEILAQPLANYNTSSSRILFVSWEGTGNGAYSGPAKRSNIKVLGPIKETLVWKRQFKLNLLTTPTDINKNNVRILPPTLDYWFDEGARITLEAPDIVPYGTGTRYVFAQWKNDTGKYSIRTLYILMNNARTANVSYYIQYYLDVMSDASQTTGTGWYNSSEQTAFSVLETIVSSSLGARRKFVDWTGNISSSTAVNHIIMIGPASVHANYVTQYFLNVTSPFSSIISKYSQNNPSNWYSEGTEVTFSILNLRVEKDFFSYYYFDGWSGDVDSIDPTVVVKMIAPIKVNAIWKEEIIFGNVFLAVLPVIVIVGTVFWLLFRKQFKTKSMTKDSGKEKAPAQDVEK